MKALRTLAILLLVAGAAGAQDQRVVKKEMVVPASLADIWHAWTTEEGAKTFFAPQANIGLKAGGDYELLLRPDAPKGSRGCEGCKIISFEPMRTLVLDWGIPPTYSALKDRRSKVTIKFESLDATHVRVAVTHEGLGIGPEWDEVYKHFDFGWGVVLSRLQRRFQTGPLDWAKLNSASGSH